MFGNINKPTFGTAAPNTSFGAFGTSTANANPFGQSQLFGKPAAGAFGSPSTSTFNMQPTNTLFPSTQAQPSNLFQNANTTFGTPPSTQAGFGTTLFGQQQPQASGLFNTSAFGQQNKPFGFGSTTTQPSLFGQQPQQQQGSSLFQPSSSSLFGGSGGFNNQQTGTVIKFTPVAGTDTMMKSGVAQSINTKHHSITCMKEYENKSFEELRFEDYSANRKGPQQQTGFGGAPFGGAPVSSAPSLFGQPDASKPAFGQSTGFGQQPTSTFGQTAGFNMGAQQQPQQQTSGMFGFGTNTSAAPTFGGGFGTTTQNANPFGGNAAAKPFGSTAQPVFGASTNTTQSSFGTGLFGQPNAQQNAGSSIFGKPAQSTMGFGATPGSSFAFNSPASTQANSLFQNKPLFGQAAPNTGFGQTNTFGTTTTPFANTFAKPGATPGFGTTQTPVFGNTLGGQQQSTGLFNSKPGGLFGNTGTGLFGNTTNTFQPNTGFGLQQQQPQQSLFPSQETQSSPNLALLTSDPFGDAPHLVGLEPKLKAYSNSVSTTDPKELKALLDSSRKVDTTNHNKLKVIPIKSSRDTLFEGISPSRNDMSPSIGEYTKTNYRRLVLKHRPNSSGDGNSSSVLGVDILSQLESPDGNKKGKENSPANKLLGTNLKVAPVRLNFENTISEEGPQSKGTSPVSKTFLINNSAIKSTAVQEKSNSLVDDLEEDKEVSSSQTLNINTQAKSHPCGVTCTRPEYYTLPALDELTQYKDENGTCFVKGFTIGRKGYGNVYFPDEIDVAGMNIDELVYFRYREINIYPDDSKKPPIGQGLNRKAQVTLDKVYPRKLGTNTLVTDINELLQMNFAEKLRKVTVKKDAKFVDYRPETGSWVFRVDHFSRYGFDDSDEDSEQNGQDGTKKKVDGAAVKQAGAASGQKTVEELAKMELLKKTKESHELSKSALDDDIMVEQDEHFQGEEDLLHHSMYVDDINEEDYHAIPMDIPMHLSYDDYKTSKNIQVMKSTLFADDDRSSDGGGSHMSIIRQFLDIPHDLERLPGGREDSVMRKRVMLRPEVFQIYNYGGCETPVGVLTSRCYQDLGLYKGKSYKVGWAKGVDFYSLDAKRGEINGELTLNKIDCHQQCRLDILQECLMESLQIVLEESTFTLDAKRIPTFKILKSDAYLKKQTELFSKLVSRFNNKQTRYIHSIWTLAGALWGPSEETISNRRHLLSEWLRDNTSYDESVSNLPADTIFNLLTTFKTLDASNLALDHRYTNLSLLISQLSVTNRSKLFLQEQIESWYKSMAANHISEDFKKLYLLLSGIPVKDGVNIFDGIDWKRALGMHLWYISPTGAPIEIAIDLYKKAFEDQSYADLPNPPYRTYYAEEGPLDILYHILTLYKTRIHRLSSVLNPATHTSDNLDYRLSWLLLQLFLSLNVGIIESSEKTKLCTSFSNQLESQGQWEWAIFALLHLSDGDLKKNLIMGILDRNLSPNVDKTSLHSEDILVNKMNIPAEWIHTVKGEKAYHLERYFEAFNHLAYAGDYCKANDILIERLLPNLFINEQYDILRLLVNSIKDGSEDILRWNCEAGLFTDFLTLQEKVISSDVDGLLKIQMRLKSISERIPHFPLKTDQQKLCIAEMSKRCASVYKEICKKCNSSLFTNSYSDFLETLVMCPDFEQNEALFLINERTRVRSK